MLPIFSFIGGAFIDGANLLITCTTAKAAIIAAIFKQIFFCHYFVAVDDSYASNWYFILFHKIYSFMVSMAVMVAILLPQATKDSFWARCYRF